MAKILVVDDSDNALKVVTSILSGDGHVTVTCKDPRDGLEKLRAEFFDLLVTDIMMPGGINGFEFVKAVKRDNAFALLPIIILTSRRELPDVEKGIIVGADDYVVKPLDPEIFLSKVRSLLQKKSRASSESFLPGSVKAKATWDVPTDIVQITEIGLDVISGISLNVGAKIRLQSEFFDEVGIRPPNLRVVECKQTDDGYRIALHFVGLSEKELTPIRLWIRSSKVRSA